MEVLVLTGMSGAGKTKCLKVLEDLGYLCVDNIMPTLISEVVKTCDSCKEASAVARLAVSADARGGVFFDGIYDALEKLKADGYRPRVFFLDATDDVLCNRYRETRRDHPLAPGGRVEKGIRAERELLAKLRERADIYLDTSHLSDNGLRQKVYDLLPEERVQGPSVILVSFGFKRGIPLDCDLVYDMRFLPNPFHEEKLRQHNGMNPEVAEYVFADPLAEEAVRGIARYVETVLDSYLLNVKPNLVAGIGCTGGKHRSVACAERLAEILKEHGVAVAVEHRDLFKE